MNPTPNSSTYETSHRAFYNDPCFTAFLKVDDSNTHHAIILTINDFEATNWNHPR